MRRTLLMLLTLIIQLLGGSSANNKEAEEFFAKCPPSNCGGGGGSIEIRYPLRLSSSPPSCGYGGLELTCSGNETILPNSHHHPFKVTNIDYKSTLITIGSVPVSATDILCPPGGNLTGLLSSPLYTILSNPVSLVSCSSDPDPRLFAGVPIRCGDALLHATNAGQVAMIMPRECVMVANTVDFPCDLEQYLVGELYLMWDLGGDLDLNFGVGFLEVYEKKREMNISWNIEHMFNGYQYFLEQSNDQLPVLDTCLVCEWEGKTCGFSWERNQSFCITPTHHHHGRRAIIIGASTSGLVIIFIVSLCAIFAYILLEKKKKLSMKIEMFLATYNSRKPTRYTYSDIKKMTKNFKHKLGEGGFGTVFKGVLSTGIPVGVKILQHSNGNMEDFINEVATMGRIHHVNIVRLLGFCSEGTKYALIYEFMSNESLEKFIFSKVAKRLSMEKMQEIALGIARGIEYLHQGCDQRILHFDIKPHNILLDENLNPKVSDFGLAKLCSRDTSAITMTAARGTLGYVAPEVYLRNFGTVSYKSDVYSFGMLLLEMASGRKNVDPTIETQSQIYFPEWAYNKLVCVEDLGLASVEDPKEKDIVKKLVIVGLWCIQMHPSDRPSMTRAIHMIMGDSDAIQLPPKPFLSSYQDIEEIVMQ